MGVWSTTDNLPKCGLAFFPLDSFFSACSFKAPITNEDFPEPETPVTTVKQPMGILAVIFLRLLWLILDKCTHFSGFLLLGGTGILSSPLRNCPVNVRDA
jgi:hypothetical protein